MMDLHVPRHHEDKRTKQKKGHTYNVLEIISVDTQGPFSIKGVDGSKYNLKIVDSKSKYITTVLMPDLRIYWSTTLKDQRDKPDGN